MKERPILFSAPMVRAILDGSKTQTRRVMRHQPDNQLMSDYRRIGEKHRVNTTPEQFAASCIPCPYGEIGDRLWVRESLIWSREAGHPTWAYAADGEIVRGGSVITSQRKKIPSIHMPRWASRITLEVTGIRVERLQDITNNDAIEEGTPDLRTLENNWDMVRCYQELWGSINGSELWIANPWVWVVSFKRINL